jgi:hypothetical protein
LNTGINGLDSGKPVFLAQANWLFSLNGLNLSSVHD